jgi:adenylate cyclase
LGGDLLVGHFVLQPAARQLLADGSVVHLGARAFDVLLALVERSDRVVSKNELLDVGWPGLVVEENNLSVQISTLRKALGAAAIATVTGRGYRLALPVLAGGRGDLPKTLLLPLPPGTGLGTLGDSGEAGKTQRTSNQIERQLLAIVDGSVVGWARLVARDPVAAAQSWRYVRSGLIEATVAQQAGRVVELSPERMQVAFTSAVNAAQWALTLQAQLKAHNRSAAARNESPLRMRIGVSVDDVLLDDGKLIGDGAVEASDLHQLAEHDDVLVTQAVCNFSAHKLGVCYAPLGERVLSQSKRSIPVFRASFNDTALGASPLTQDPTGKLASVAVLPLSTEGSPEDAYLGDGLTEEIIAMLSLDRSLFVIAHSTTSQLRLRQSDLTEVAAELGVSYLLTGSLRRAGPRLRISVALELASSHQVIWQHAEVGQDGELFDAQSRIATGIAAAISPPLQASEINRNRQRPTASFGAYDCVLRALPGMYRFGESAFESCGQWLKQAIDIDPQYAQAHAHLAWWYSLCAGEGQATAQTEQRELAVDHALRAAALDGRDAYVLSVAGHLLTLFKKQYGRANDLLEQAITINPGSAWAWARGGATLAYQGRTDEALARVKRAMQLSPFDTNLFAFYVSGGIACLAGERNADAVGWLGKAMRLSPGFVGAKRLQIAALARVGEHAEARALASELLIAQPEFTVAEFGEWYPLKAPFLEPLLQAMRRGGLP